MKALFYDRYGSPDNIRIIDIDRPVPADKEVLVKIHAATVNRTDCAYLRAHPFFMRLLTGFLKPKKNIPGTDFSGTVEDTGKDAAFFKKGDRVFGFSDTGLSSHAEYIVISDNTAAGIIPENISFEEAAGGCEGAHYAVNFINKIDLKRGDRVLVNGATGAIGSAAVQLLKYYGAEITAVCPADHFEKVRSFGASKVIDYNKDDFTETGGRYSFIFDTVGKSSFFKCRNLLEDDGVYISSEPGYMYQNIYLAVFTPLFKKRVVKFPYPDNIQATIDLMKSLLEKGLFKPLIDREYPMEKAAEAFRYVETGQKIGNVILKISGE